MYCDPLNRPSHSHLARLSVSPRVTDGKGQGLLSASRIYHQQGCRVSNHRMAGLLGQKGKRSRSHCDEGRREPCGGAGETQGEMEQEGIQGAQAGDPHTGRLSGPPGEGFFLEQIPTPGLGLLLCEGARRRQPGTLPFWPWCSSRPLRRGGRQGPRSRTGPPSHWALGWALSCWTVTGSPQNPFHMWQEMQS